MSLLKPGIRHILLCVASMSQSRNNTYMSPDTSTGNGVSDTSKREELCSYISLLHVSNMRAMKVQPFVNIRLLRSL